MKHFALVFLGGGIGSMLRYGISKTLNSYLHHFFLGTFMVNIIGCLLIGLNIGFSLKGNYITENQTLLLATGFCGGFTTFSAFTFEEYTLLKDGEFLNFSIYALASVVTGLLAVFLGLWLAKLQ
ncbi:MAG: fluoride efflux transporter CrcB [Maribacter sp.]|nr:fluoride efflux transporter CrcB [Maribacter sp.]